MSQFISYAQNFEDVMLWRALQHVKRGSYIDVGAQHPVIDSVSLAFYEHGWRGTHVEPVSYYADLLREHRSDEAVIQAAMGARQGLLTFFDIKETGLSTADENIARRHQQSGFEVRETVVPCMTLDEVLSPHIGQAIHWLKIDVEGYERQVLEGWRVEVRPWVVVIESTSPNSQTESHHNWEHLIAARDYRFAYFDGLNRFYVSSEHAGLLSAFRHGPTVFDNFVLTGSSLFCARLQSMIEGLRERVQILERERGAHDRDQIPIAISGTEMERISPNSDSLGEPEDPRIAGTPNRDINDTP